MAVRPEIALQGRITDIGQTFSNALLNVQRIGQLAERGREAPLRARILEAQTQAAEASVPTAQQTFDIAEQNKIKSLGVAAQQILPDLQAGRIDTVVSSLQRRSQALIDAGISNEDTLDAIDLALNDPNELLTRSQQAINLASGLKPAGKTQFGGQQTFKDSQGNLFFGTTKRNPLDGSVQSVLAPISGSPNQPVGQVSLVSSLGETAAEVQQAAIVKAGGVAEVKEKAKLKFKPQIEKAVIAARKEATNRGEIFNELSQAKAALPSLTKAVDELRELSTVATSTFGGKIFDAAVKETGFGATKGSTARAKFIAVINNQVLPLLKPTFGAAFTVQEGESLKATMGDPDASPAEKMAQLDAFMAQKLRDIETKETQLTPASQILQPDQNVTTQPEAQGVIRFDRQGNRVQ